MPRPAPTPATVPLDTGHSAESAELLALGLGVALLAEALAAVVEEEEETDVTAVAKFASRAFSTACPGRIEPPGRGKVTLLLKQPSGSHA